MSPLDTGSALHAALCDAQLEFASIAYLQCSPPYDPADEAADLRYEEFGLVEAARAIARRACVRKGPVTATEDWRAARDALDAVAIDFAAWADAHPAEAARALCRGGHGP